ncbi:MAG: ATP-dependent Clp protease adaptor ClpS [Isosphaeraceae bacterium]
MSEPQESESGTAVAEPPVVRPKQKPKTDTTTSTRKQPPYHVIILNDEEHTFEYVIDLLRQLFAHPQEAAEILTWRIHNTGRAVVYTCHKEKAEFKRDQVLAGGADPRMKNSKGPLQCYIEPAESEGDGDGDEGKE